MSIFPFFKKKCHTAQCAKNRLHASVRTPPHDIVSNIQQTILDALGKFPRIQENNIHFSWDKKQKKLTISVPIQSA